MAYAVRDHFYSDPRAYNEVYRYEYQDGCWYIPRSFCSHWDLLQHEPGSLEYDVPLSKHVIYSNVEGWVMRIFALDEAADYDTRRWVQLRHS